MKDAAKALQRLNEKRNSKIISAGGLDKKDSTSALPARDRGTIYYIGHAGGVGRWFYCDAQAYELCTVRYKGRFDAQVETTKWDNWDLFGFTPKDFIPAAWELLPWSFLADYFTNIGDILSSVTVSTTGLAYVNRTEIKHTYYRGAISHDPFHPNNMSANFTLTSCIGGQGSFNLTRRAVVRSPGSGISYPTLQFNVELNPGQLANVAALLATSRALHPQNPRPLHRLPGM
jgi:hypothetical protein